MIREHVDSGHSPLDRLREIQENCGAKKQQLNAAQCGTDKRAVADAQRDYDDAVADLHAFQQSTATGFFYGLNLAVRENREYLQRILLELLADPIADAILSAQKAVGNA